MCRGDRYDGRGQLSEVKGLTSVNVLPIVTLLTIGCQIKKALTLEGFRGNGNALNIS